jgi:hypothetical protein
MLAFAQYRALTNFHAFNGPFHFLRRILQAIIPMDRAISEIMARGRPVPEALRQILVATFHMLQAEHLNDFLVWESCDGCWSKFRVSQTPSEAACAARKGIFQAIEPDSHQADGHIQRAICGARLWTSNPVGGCSKYANMTRTASQPKQVQQHK